MQQPGVRGSSLASMGLAGLVLLYIPVQGGYVVMTRLASGASGLAILPYSLLAYMAVTFLFIWLSGWHRDAGRLRIAGALALPVPGRETALSGAGSAMMLCAIPLSYSLAGVSIPLMLLLVRGGVLFAAPLIDVLNGRRIHWWSGTALALVATAVLLGVQGHDVMHLPRLALLAVALYDVGYLLRLAMMTRIAKRGDAARTRRFYVEEKLVALPLACIALAAMVMAGDDGAAGFGALRIHWSATLAAAALGMGLAMAATSLLTSLILLNARENSFCVPLERATSLLAGMAGAGLLYWGWRQPPPTRGEMLAAGLLLAAILLLARARKARRT